MALPRSKYVQEGQEGVYHCFSRCVRRAFLYGFDPLTRRDFSHRKAWLVDRLRLSRGHLRHRSLCLRHYGESLSHYSAYSPRYRRPVVRSGSGNPLADTLPPTSQPERHPNSACRERNLRSGGLSGTYRRAAPTLVEPELVHGPAERIHRSGGKQRGSGQGPVLGIAVQMPGAARRSGHRRMHGLCGPESDPGRYWLQLRRKATSPASRNGSVPGRKRR